MFGCPKHRSVTKQDVQKCIDLAMLQETILDLPEKLDTFITVGGNILSGGQKQRVAIARARLRDIPILILDECTSALDYKTRKQVTEAIRRWREGKTTIIITHDLSQIGGSDLLYVLEHGRVVCSGYRSVLEKESQDKLKHLVSYCQDTMSCCEDDQAIFKLPQQMNYSLCSGPSDENDLDISAESDRESIADMQINVSKDKVCRTFLSLDKAKSPCSMSQSRRSQDPKAGDHLARVEEIIFSIFSRLDPRERAILIIALLCTLVHAIATPVFSYMLSRLFRTFYIPEDRSQNAMKWSLAIFAVGFFDTTASYLMNYLLEYCGQAWICSTRKTALTRILDQPLSWFERAENKPSTLVTSLTQDAEDIRNIISKFIGFALLVIAIISIATIWSVFICWKLTLVILTCAPLIYAIINGFENISKEWQIRCGMTKANLSSIFADTFSNIKTVRALSLELYFHKKHMRTSAKAIKVGFRRAGYSGLLFGLADSTVILVSGRPVHLSF
jgi:ATP-binding cassette subfamily B (MDR/TAP) protein 1